jgi:hypothetical protein
MPSNIAEKLRNFKITQFFSILVPCLLFFKIFQKKLPLQNNLKKTKNIEINARKIQVELSMFMSNLLFTAK